MTKPGRYFVKIPPALQPLVDNLAGKGAGLGAAIGDLERDPCATCRAGFEPATDRFRPAVALFLERGPSAEKPLINLGVGNAERRLPALDERECQRGHPGRHVADADHRSDPPNPARMTFNVIYGNGRLRL